ncbi:MarR family transcriptional regulator [Rhodanobacter denitrificans]|jgi:MarR family transcriptional repressor of emrRAB|uniref:Transcriptional regulator n=1 Tax=Rhodanobacter denitrificans TaxID=666685 RepID=I4WWH9_9GAMM|nr:MULTISPECIES: MarR family transcriptional regulator [Rhodanobacter]AGG89480.1 transcriptional regulator [Rhodanobacter denitrificans]EIM03821.1 MarR family transcriptional regulator [Rhodanobacter denitrificans]UJM88360.1 MarR family transcriptional regulator [Rhodanobacter denitrificans]UJM88624.1 MarR family transcriptional regulator [Rhodanobacter denitrificans]
MARLANCITMMDEGVGRVSQIIPQVPALEARLCRLMLMLGDDIEEELEFKLKAHKLNHSEFLTLMILYSRPDGSSTPGELCEYTSQGATNMTRIANALVKRGLITRGGSEADRRRVLIRITAAGRRFVQKMLPPMFPRVATMFAGFSDTDKRHFDRLLRKLAGNLDQLGESRLP